MYAIENVRKYLADEFLKGNWYVNERNSQAILARARARADAFGVLMAGGIPDIFGPGGEEQILMAGFCQALSELEHAEIGLAALRARSSAQTVP